MRFMLWHAGQKRRGNSRQVNEGGEITQAAILPQSDLRHHDEMLGVQVRIVSCRSNIQIHVQ